MTQLHTKTIFYEGDRETNASSITVIRCDKHYVNNKKKTIKNNEEIDTFFSLILVFRVMFLGDNDGWLVKNTIHPTLLM